ncbi:hypothetical protein OG292_23670 [Streptomyces sp. NBC_01511]|uniref:DUF6879 family protein n=1 Tax=Streptomyces sp. NBC_01511 TaxID=2903889 RepID=UPI00386C19D2
MALRRLGKAPTFDELFRNCRSSAVHLEMRDGYMKSDPVFIDWHAGRRIDPAERWPEWHELVPEATGRGVAVRRARIVSEPVSEYIRFEYEVTEGLNISAGEKFRWLSRRHATGKNAGLTARGLARQADWHESKCSRFESGSRRP